MKKKNRLYYLCLLVLVVIISSCGPSASKKGAQEAPVSNELTYIEEPHSNDSIELIVDSLSKNMAVAFEKRALQKLEDLKDYLEIISDSAIENPFKEQAIGMALNLFVSENSKVAFILSDNDGDTIIAVNKLLSLINEGQYGSLRFEIKKKRVLKGLEKNKYGDYQGTISFHLFIFKNSEKKKALLRHYNMNSTIIAKKIKKNFGNNSKTIWEILFDDISKN